MMYWTPLTDLAGCAIVLLFGCIGIIIVKQIIKPGMQQSETERKCYVVEDAVIEKIAKGKGYNIAELDARNKVVQEKNFHKMLREKAIEEFFGKGKQ